MVSDQNTSIQNSDRKLLLHENSGTQKIGKGITSLSESVEKICEICFKLVSFKKCMETSISKIPSLLFKNIHTKIFLGYFRFGDIGITHIHLSSFLSVTIQNFAKFWDLHFRKYYLNVFIKNLKEPATIKISASRRKTVIPLPFPGFWYTHFF